MADSPRISAFIITLNEAHNIGECIRSVSWCDEVVVLDSESTDGTRDIAKSMGAKVHTGGWLGFGPQKQAALELTGSAWAFSIDADERCPEPLRDEILSAISSASPSDGYMIPRKNLYRGRWLRWGGQYPDYVLRVFKRNRGRFSPDPVHERVLLDTVPARLRTPLEHHTFESLESRINKLNRYSCIAARELYDRGRRCGPLDPLTHLIAFFVKDYVLRLGFLDGAAGFDMALLKSLGAYYKYAKLREFPD